MSVTARLAEFAVKTSLEECPPEALARVRLAALDTLGVMLAGAGEPAARAVRAVARAEGGTPLATVVGTRFVTAPGWAALANGTAGHAHDFDDTNFALMGHPSVPLLATALASGLKENFGSMTKPYHAGHAARSGILAAQLAREGVTASETALEGRQGYVAAFGGARPLEPALDGLGRAWQLLVSGIAVKPYPSCALTHSAIDSLLDLRAAHGLTPRDVTAVEVAVNRVVPDVL